MQLEVKKTRLITIFSWFIAFIVLFYYVRSCSYNKEVGINLVVSAIDIACLIVCSYLLRSLLVPKYLYEKKIFLFVSFVVLLIVFIAILMQIFHSIWYSITDTLTFNQETLFKHYYYQLFSCWWVTLCGCLCIITFKLIEDQLITINRYNQLQKEKAQTELSFLKAQINPHFLFNSINSIFANIDKSNILARETVLRFSDMLRYQLYECNVDEISFEKEFAYINNYVALQKLRRDNNLVVSIDNDIKQGHFTIAPLLLVPFIENAFKYLSSFYDQENKVAIACSKDDDYFSFTCYNTKEVLPSNRLFEDGGIGIQNVKRRLDLVYPNKHELSIKNMEYFFEVNLKIKIN